MSQGLLQAVSAYARLSDKEKSAFLQLSGINEFIARDPVSYAAVAGQPASQPQYAAPQMSQMTLAPMSAACALPAAPQPSQLDMASIIKAPMPAANWPKLVEEASLAMPQPQTVAERRQFFRQNPANVVGQPGQRNILALRNKYREQLVNLTDDEIQRAPTVFLYTQVSQGGYVDPKTGRVFAVTLPKERTPEYKALMKRQEDCRIALSDAIRKYRGITHARPDEQIDLNREYPTDDKSEEALAMAEVHAAKAARDAAKDALTAFKEAHPDQFKEDPWQTTRTNPGNLVLRKTKVLPRAQAPAVPAKPDTAKKGSAPSTTGVAKK